MILTTAKVLVTWKPTYCLANHWVFCRSVAEHHSVKCTSQEFCSFIPWCWQNKYHPHSMTELKLTIFLFYLLIQSFGQCWSRQYAGWLTLYNLVKTTLPLCSLWLNWKVWGLFNDGDSDLLFFLVLVKKIGPRCVHVWLTKLSCFSVSGVSLGFYQKS